MARAGVCFALMDESSGMPTPPLHASLFGSFKLTTADGAELVISGKRARALLALLCIAPGEACDREQLSALLWRGRFRAQARASLRQTLLELKKLLAPACVEPFEVTRERVAIRPGVVRTDLAALENALAEGRMADASECLTRIGTGALLDGFDFGDAFAQWLAAQRAEVEQRLQQAIEQAIEQTLAASSPEGIDPERSRLFSAWRLRDPATVRTDSSAEIRIAVLPFKPPSGDESLALFAQGLFDELVTTLGQVPQLRVAGRGSSLRLKDSSLNLTDLARTLHASHLLEGSIQRHGDALRVHVSLVDGDTGFETWARGHHGSVEGLFTLQEEIAKAVTQELGDALQLRINAPAHRRTTLNKEAYALYLQGRALTARAIGDGVLAKAVELLEASLTIDPDFAACWTALAEAHVYTTVYTPCLDRLEKSAKMAECAGKAIELEPTQGHARAMLGIHRWTLNDPVGALDLAHEAYRLEPHNPDVVLRLGSFLLYIGRTREALPYIKAAVDQDPVNGRNFAMLSVAQFNLGNIDAAIAAGQRMVDLGLPSMWLAVATAASGQHKLAVDQYRQTRLLMNSVIFPPAGTRPLTGTALKVFWQIAAKGVCSGQKVHRTLYRALLDQLHAALPDPVDTSIVMPAIWMGHSSLVFKTLGKQITPANMFCLMSLWADIEPIRQIRLHPDFPAFAERTGLVKAWEKYGWPDLLPS